MINSISYLTKVEEVTVHLFFCTLGPGDVRRFWAPEASGTRWRASPKVRRILDASKQCRRNAGPTYTKA